MTAIEETRHSWDAEEAWSDLRVPLRDLTYMAGIARDLAYELLDLEVVRRTTRMVDGEVTIRMSEREYEQFFFAVSDVFDGARAIEKLYPGKRSFRRIRRDRAASGRPFVDVGCDTGHCPTRGDVFEP
jgi:hypothetical protein